MGTVVALHGFTRSPSHLVAFSEACQRRGWSCVRPQLAPRWLPILMNDRRHLSAVARRIADSGLLDGPVVIVGHSAGAASATWIAPQLIDAGIDLRGLVYVDGNDSPNRLIERSWSRIESLPVRAIRAPPSPCNRHGRLAAFLEDKRPGSAVEIAGSGHGDIEMTGASVYRRVCQDTSGVPEWRAVQTAVLDAVGSLLEDG